MPANLGQETGQNLHAVMFGCCGNFLLDRLLCGNIVSKTRLFGQLAKTRAWKKARLASISTCASVSTEQSSA